MESCRPENRGIVNLTQEAAPMSETDTVNPLRQHMIEDMNRRHGGSLAQLIHQAQPTSTVASGLRRWLKTLAHMQMPDEANLFQPHLIESGTSICNRIGS